MSNYFLGTCYLFIGILGTLFFKYIWTKFLFIGFDRKIEIQKIHESEALRTGGIFIIVLTVMSSIIFSTFSYYPYYFVFFLPLIIVASLEDLFQNISINLRFISMIFSSFLLVIFTDAILLETDIEYINSILSIKFIAIIITVLGIVVTCNAWNFIDGLNGVASGLGAFVLLILSYYMDENILYGLKDFLFLASFITFGFSIVNILTGRVFLGDTGAYVLGTLVGWSGVIIASKNNQVSAWAIFLIIIYPATEITVSVFRRIFKRASPFKSDRSHFHFLVYELILNYFSLNPRIVNSISGVIIIFISIIPGVYCLIIDGIFPNTLIACLVFFLLYILAYIFLSNMLEHSIKNRKK